ncbi:ATP-binding cassette bilirubin transporter [Saccharomycopsis crataegensis]|uniref:ATP-binding cassette bilirubin transporter n=1 Tax=Saccharomycopsis crataegensis TaxID=43959 RepID=A0AAV5QI02_9ASCO|nr:ATP-binding cassette bilirubin transporter [Saccharomycopsis crataegensis]
MVPGNSPIFRPLATMGSYFNQSVQCQNLSVLVPTKENAFNPCFLAAFLIAFSSVFFVLGSWQLLVTKRKQSYGKLFSIRSEGFTHFLRIALVATQAVLNLVLFDDILSSNNGVFSWTSISYFLTFVLLAAVLLPLHITEVHKSIWQLGTPLVYWILTPFILCGYVYQTNYTNYALSSSTTFKVAEFATFINSIFIFILEVFLWKRVHEYTYHLKLNQVNVDSLYNTNIIGRISFSNLNPLVSKVYKEGTLEFDDLPEISEDLTAEKCSAVLEKHWAREMTKEKADVSLIKPLLRAFGTQMLACTVLQILQILASFVQPQLLRVLMSFFLTADNSEPQVLHGILICVGMFITSLVMIVLWNEYINQMYNISFKIRVSLTVLIYEKALKLSTKARANKTVGDIVNLISVDTTRVEYLVTQLQTFVSSPLQFILCIFSLYFLLGLTSFSGLAVIAVALPVNLIAIKKMEALYDVNMKFKDKRTKLVSEILSSIKSIKLYSWEKPMKERVTDVRNNEELETMKKIGIIDCIISFSWSCVPYFVSCATFAAFSFFGDVKLTSDLIFPSLALFELLGDPLFQIPDVISSFMEAKVSIARLLKFLTDEELDSSLIAELQAIKLKGEVSVEIKNATFLRSDAKKIQATTANVPNSTGTPTDEEACVESTGSQIALSNIDFAAKKGELTCIVGSVGSGKTTFLQSILGHYPVVAADEKHGSPSVNVRGVVAYCPQQPWIMNSSIKKNILFGHKYDPEFFEKTIEACELKSDFEILPDGEETQVGEKGISLSGGQKARISLARAVYARADIYLLDDVLSAVDAHVSKNIIERVLCKTGILSSKTLVLSTNNIHVLEEADSIYVLDHGKIDEQGTYDELINDKGEFAKLIEEFGKADTTKEDSESATKEESIDNVAEDKNEAIEVIEDADMDEMTELTRVMTNRTLRRASVSSFNHKFTPADNEKSDKRVTGQSKEVSKKGKVSWSTYKRYAQAAKYRNVMLTAFAIIMTGVADFLGKLWLKHWADVNDSDDSSTSTVFLVTVYTILGLVSGISVLCVSLSFSYFSAISASKAIHEELVTSILKSPMSFFETTPTGRVLNRFSEDISRLDERFPHSLNFFTNTVVKTVYTLGLIIFTLPSTIIFVILLSFVYSYIQKYYIAASRETKRFASITRSPVYSHIHETLVGVDTIRAFDQENRFKHINGANLDHGMSGILSQIWMTRWLNFRLKTISTVFLLIVTLSCVFTLKSSAPLAAGAVGLLTTFSMQICDHLNWFVRMTVEVETNAVAVERVFEYCDLQSEKPYVIENSRPPIQWPMKGGIKFENYTTKYNADANPVLKNVSFEVKPQEKIGIVGRTGAGKSTLTLALFRIIEATGGSIVIDDVDTSKIGMYDLRSKLNIIPQDSQAFEGTVRQNLDPFSKCKDEELWKALEMAHLKDHVMSMKDEEKNKDDHEQEDASESEAGTQEGAGEGLYAKVNEGGSNLSAGQKQLLCLARALLNPSRILILDEATAAVDVKTDKIVQETIRKEFSDRTILTIAHRIDTIMDNDKILVLDRGEVKEFDSPANLLKDKDTIFYSLCERGGYLKK